MVSTIEEVRRDRSLSHVSYTPYRIKYTKTGKLKYISHLDLLRTMQRVFLRAELPVWYSEGFNPQPKLSFGLPLSVGCDSCCEYMDVRLTEAMICEEMAARLSDALPEEMSVVRVYNPTTKYNEIGYAGYAISIRSGGMEEEIVSRVKELFSKELLMEKQTKRGTKTIDLSGMIRRLDVRYENSVLILDTVLPSSNDRYINPELIVTALQDRLGLLRGNIMEESYDIVRNEVYFSDGESVFA